MARAKVSTAIPVNKVKHFKGSYMNFRVQVIVESNMKGSYLNFRIQVIVESNMKGNHMNFKIQVIIESNMKILVTCAKLPLLLQRQ